MVVFVPGELSTIEEQNQEQNGLLRRGEYRSKGYKPETVLGSSPIEDVGFRISLIIFSYDIQCSYRMIRPMIGSAIKIDMKCKHLSKFAAVTLRALC
jgi:hypothetical protein